MTTLADFMQPPAIPDPLPAIAPPPLTAEPLTIKDTETCERIGKYKKFAKAWLKAAETRATHRLAAPVWLTSNGSEDHPATEWTVRRVMA